MRSLLQKSQTVKSWSHIHLLISGLPTNTGVLFHWRLSDPLLTFCSCLRRAQPPLPEHAPAQFQTWRVLPILGQLPQQPDPRPGRNGGRPAPGPQRSGQRCHPELQPGTCPKSSPGLSHPKIVQGGSWETELLGARRHVNVCLYFPSSSTHLQREMLPAPCSTSMFVNLKQIVKKSS